MYQEISKLLMYGDLSQDEILYKLGQLFEQFEVGEYNKTELVRDINTQVKRILKVATDYGFDDNLWHNYLTFFLMMSENPFSITCEKVGASDGSVNGLVANDFRIFKKLFDYDFKPIESALGIDCFTQISNYKAIVKKDLMYNHNVSEKVRALSKKLEAAKDEQEFFDVVTGFYKAYGVGMFGLNKAFRIEEHLDGGFSFMPINNMDAVMLDDLIGYEIQKKKLTDNTEAFVQGKKANNVLLFGDSGTGKSTSIKAIVNQYYDDGLRMIEIYKHQFKYLSKIIAAIKNRNYRFIIYMDDLSFEEHEIEYKFLKAVIEGGDAFLVYPNTEVIYQADAQDPWEYTWVGFTGSDAATILRATDFTKAHPYIHSVSNGNEIKRQLMHIYDARGTEFENALEMTGRLYTTLALFVSAATSKPPQNSANSYVQKGIEYISANYSYPITVEDIASYIGLSRSHLFRSFQSILGVSPKEYLTDFRIKQACYLLKHSSLSITAIAGSIGFDNSLYFSKTFHKIKGLSPKEYRSKYKKA